MICKASQETATEVSPGVKVRADQKPQAWSDLAALSSQADEGGGDVGSIQGRLFKWLWGVQVIWSTMQGSAHRQESPLTTQSSQ